MLDATNVSTIRPVTTVHPGAFCSPPGSEGRTANDTVMQCRSVNNDRARWRGHPDHPARPRRRRTPAKGTGIRPAHIAHLPPGAPLTDRAVEQLSPAELEAIRAATDRPRTGIRKIRDDTIARLKKVGILAQDGTATARGVDALDRVDGPESYRLAGRDRLDDVVADLAGERAEYEGRRRANRQSLFDRFLQGIAKKQSFDAYPKVGTRESVDAAVKAGWTQVWRGVQDSPHRTAADINGDLREGTFQPGRGLYGNGVYTSTRRQTAEHFRGREPVTDIPSQGPDFTEADLDGDAAPDSLLRIAIDPAANVIDYDQLITEQKAWFASRPDLSNTAPRIILSDPGRFAAARGYDVIRVVDRADGGYYPGWENATDLDGIGNNRQADQYVILNRTVMLIQRVEDTP